MHKHLKAINKMMNRTGGVINDADLVVANGEKPKADATNELIEENKATLGIKGTWSITPEARLQISRKCRSAVGDARGKIKTFVALAKAGIKVEDLLTKSEDEANKIITDAKNDNGPSEDELDELERQFSEKMAHLPPEKLEWMKFKRKPKGRAQQFLDRILGKPEINDAKDALALLIKKGFEVGIASNNFQSFIQNFISYHSGSLNGENGRKPERIEPSIARVVAAGVRIRDFPGQPQRMGQGDQDKIKPKPDFLIRVMDYWKNQYKWEPTEKKDHVVFIDDRDTGAKAAAAAEETAREALKLNRDVKFLRVAAPGGHLTPETIAEIDKESMPHLVADLGQLTQLLVDEGERKKLVVVQHSNGKITAVHKDLLEEFLGHGWTVAE